MKIEKTASFTIPANSTVVELKQALSTALAELRINNIPEDAEVNMSYQPYRYDQRDNWESPATVTVRIDW